MAKVRFTVTLMVEGNADLPPALLSGFIAGAISKAADDGPRPPLVKVVNWPQVTHAAPVSGR